MPAAPYDGLVICSVPSAVHSHKPPLDSLLQKMFSPQLDLDWAALSKLEIFGRNLQPGWTTVGNQPCLLNLISPLPTK